MNQINASQTAAQSIADDFDPEDGLPQAPEIVLCTQPGCSRKASGDIRMRRPCSMYTPIEVLECVCYRCYMQIRNTYCVSGESPGLVKWEPFGDASPLWKKYELGKVDAPFPKTIRPFTVDFLTGDQLLVAFALLWGDLPAKTLHAKGVFIERDMSGSSIARRLKMRKASVLSALNELENDYRIYRPPVSPRSKRRPVWIAKDPRKKPPVLFAPVLTPQMVWNVVVSRMDKLFADHDWPALRRRMAHLESIEARISDNFKDLWIMEDALDGWRCTVEGHDPKPRPLESFPGPQLVEP